MKKRKIVLGGYVNVPNAQNINCKALAEYLDKDIFEVHTFYIIGLDIDKEKFKKSGVHLHGIIFHRWIYFWMRMLIMLFGRFDIFYLPKREHPDRVLCKILKNNKKKILVASVEGCITSDLNNCHAYRDYYLQTVDSFFAISNGIANDIKREWRREVPVCPLGVYPMDCTREGGVKNLSSIAWIGNVIPGKRPMLFVDIAEKFPELQFVMVGDGSLFDEVKQKIKSDHVSNISMTGRVDNDKVYQILMSADLLLMTSEYEGLPKVIQEAALCGVPSIYMCEKYSVDFIKNGWNGYGVTSIEEMQTIIHRLKENPEELRTVSDNAKESIKQYYWPKVAEQYNALFLNLSK